MSVRVTARGYAGKIFTLTRSTPPELVMTEGASFKGRVLRAGTPLAGVTVGLSESKRDYDGNYGVRTDARGNFKFEHLAPETDYQVFSPLATLTPSGALPTPGSSHRQGRGHHRSGRH